MTVKDRHASDHCIVKSITASTEPATGTFTVEPEGPVEHVAICCVGQENMYWANFLRVVDDSPVKVSSHSRGFHRAGHPSILFAVDVESVFVLSNVATKSGFAFS
jgi:hypothetical protein